MRHRVIITALVAAAACRPITVPTEPRQSVTFEIQDATTKASGGEVSSLAALIFRENGTLDSYARCDGNTVTADVSSGISLRWYLVANAPDELAGIATQQAFLQKPSLLEHSSQWRVMTGHGDGVLSEGEKVTVALDRIVSRVSLESIEARFLEDCFISSEVHLKEVFLMNVPGSCPYGMQQTSPVARLVQGGDHSQLKETLRGMLVREDGRSLDQHKRNLDYSFYCCPEDAQSASLVVHVDIDSEPNYYPIALPLLKCNTHYRVTNLVLLGPGAARPDEPVSRESIAFTIEITPWENEEKNVEFS